jgi:hypothetical protein
MSPPRLIALLAALLAPAAAASLPFTLAETGLTLGPLNGVAFGNGTFVVSTATAANLRVFTSPDGTTWRETLVRPQSTNAANSPVRFVNGRFLLNDVTVVGNVVTSNFRTSTDGVSWTNTTTAGAPGQIVNDAAGDGTRLIAGGGTTSTAYLATSPNSGTTWTNLPPLGGLGRWTSVVHGGGRWFLAGAFTVGFETRTRLYTSTDGLAFTESTAAPAPVSVAYGAGRWLVVGAGGTTGYTSTDGVTFTATSYAADSTFSTTPNSVRYLNDRFISLLTPKRYLHSADGRTWSDLEAAFPAAAELTGPVDLAYGNGRYVVVTAPARLGSASSIYVADASVASTAGRLINLSVLTDLTAPGDTFTLGYVVGGPGTVGEKPVVLRAAGPSLGALGVPDTLADPRLALFAGSTPNGENDNWGGTADLTAALARVGAFAYASPTSLDAAVATTLATRDNSVQISATDRGTGKVIAEIYDATPTATFTTTTPRLLNVSVRKHLGAGLTAGFVLGGTSPTRVLIRAIGPGLAAFGVEGTVADPQLTLFNSASARIDSNDNWSGTPALTAAFAAVGAFALPSATSRDAALVTTLAPGNYTVEISASATSTSTPGLPANAAAASGTALVEIYEVP